MGSRADVGGRIAVYPGSFDPVTVGHRDIIERAAALFDRLIVAVAPLSSNVEKRPLFTIAERIDFLRETCADLPNVEVDALDGDGLLVEYAVRRGAGVIVKGLRAMSDFEYEYAMALMNRRLRPEVDTLYLMASAECSYLSSTLVKEVARLGGALDGIVSASVAEALRKKLRSS
jgi:pantetheine-phosphate adenylyltransferase